MRVCILNDRTHPRAWRIADALVEGAQAIGWQVSIAKPEDRLGHERLLLAYGWKHQLIFETCRASGGHFLYVDLGYWHRKAFRGDFGGLHKVVLDARHATSYFQRRRPPDRLANAPPIAPWQTAGSHIVLAGLSGKGAQSCGFQNYEWERRTIARLQQMTNRPIVYRPKPSWGGAKPLAGARFSPATEPLEAALSGAWALVAHYSNAAIDALFAGIPVVAEEGLATALSTPFAQIERPNRPDGREQFRADVSYTQFSRAEIVSGAMFRQFLDDGLLP